MIYYLSISDLWKKEFSGHYKSFIYQIIKKDDFFISKKIVQQKWGQIFLPP
jgi:hypothetical protein